MEKVHSIIIRKGFIVESDHPYAYAMQHFEAFSDIVDWMAEHDYIGEFEAEGYFDPKSGAVYGIFDSLSVGISGGLY